MTSEDIAALRMIHKRAALRAMNRKDFSDQLIALETVNDIFHDIVKLAEGHWYDVKFGEGEMDERKEENDEG